MLVNCLGMPVGPWWLPALFLRKLWNAWTDYGVPLAEFRPPSCGGAELCFPYYPLSDTLPVFRGGVPCGRESCVRSAPRAAFQRPNCCIRSKRPEKAIAACPLIAEMLLGHPAAGRLSGAAGPLRMPQSLGHSGQSWWPPPPPPPPPPPSFLGADAGHWPPAWMSYPGHLCGQQSIVHLRCSSTPALYRTGPNPAALSRARSRWLRGFAGPEGLAGAFFVADSSAPLSGTGMLGVAVIL